MAVVIPAFNEERSIGKVLADIPASVTRVVVADNASTDRTAEEARKGGACVVHESRKGYGYACLKALKSLAQDPPAIVVFLDGDYSDYPEELPLLTQPIASGAVDFVVGARRVAGREKGGAYSATDLWQCLGLYPDALVIWRTIHRLRSLPRHTLGSAARTRDGRQVLWLDSGNAIESIAASNSLSGSARALQKTHWEIESIWDGERDYISGLEDHRLDH